MEEAALMAFDAAAGEREESCLDDFELSLLAAAVAFAVSIYPSESGLPKQVIIGSMVKLPAASADGKTNSTASATL